MAQGGSRRPGWIRIIAMASTGAAALTALAYAIATGSMLLGLIGLVCVFIFVLIATARPARSPEPQPRTAPLTRETAEVRSAPVQAPPAQPAAPSPRPEPAGPGSAEAEPQPADAAVETAPADAAAEAAPATATTAVEPETARPAPEPTAEETVASTSTPDEEPAAQTSPESSAPRPVLRMPPDMDAKAVATALLDASQQAGQAVAAHFWLEDPSSGTMRLVAAAGPMTPAPHPLPLDDDPIGLAVKDRAARLTAVAGVHAGGESTRLWRYAVPVKADGAYGVAAIDFSSAEAPDATRLVEITSALRGFLAGTLALHVASTELNTARMLLETARELSRRIDPDEVVKHTLERAMSISDAATGSVMLVDPVSGTMSIAAAKGLPRHVVQETVVREGEGIAGWVLATRKAVLVEDLPGREGRARRGNVRSAVSVPIADQDGILGVLNVGSRAYPARFTDAHTEALGVLGTQTAVALRNARAVGSARDLYFATLRALALAMETKDPYARGATDRVVRSAMALGRAMGLDETEMQSLEVASLLHDIGMSATGETVVACDRPLSTFERGLLKLHPVLAAEILEEVPALRNVIPIVYHHHEHYDGEGYVVGLSGESIPLGSRILAVADAFNAMTSKRPYRGAMTAEQALQELQDKAGSQFDPEVVSAFAELLRRDPSLAPDEARG